MILNLVTDYNACRDEDVVDFHQVEVWGSDVFAREFQLNSRSKAYVYLWAFTLNRSRGGITINRAKSVLIFTVLLPFLIASVALNIYLVTRPPTLMGLVDHKKIGHGTDQAGETTWYTVSLWLFKEDKVNKFAAGETIAYIVDEDDFNRVETGDVVEGVPRRALGLDILEVIRRPSSSITWQRNGGLIGLSEELAVAADGSTSYTSNLFGSAELALTKSEVEDLFDKAAFIKEDVSYAAKTGAADYYAYKLTMRAPSGVRKVEWVDEWASEDDLPRDLKELQSHMESIVVRARQQTGAWEDADKRAVEIAREFVVHGPTFVFDGMPETVNVTEIQILESFPVQYVVTVIFDSGHAGYGNRTGQVLLPVVTSHTAVVKVVNDNVVSAILDGQWDELRQRPIS